MTTPAKFYTINGVVVTYVEYIEWLESRDDDWAKVISLWYYSDSDLVFDWGVTPIDQFLGVSQTQSNTNP